MALNTTNKPKPILALKGYSRSGAFALDTTSLYDSYADAIAYVRTSKAVYPSQIISVDDKLRKTAKIYKVVYNPYYDVDGINITGEERYKYTLEEIEVKSSTGSIVNFKGKLNDKSLLPTGNDAKNQDMYYVFEDGNYIPYVYLDGEWEKIDHLLNIAYASEFSDGIITSNFYNKIKGNLRAGVFYNPGIKNIEDQHNRKAKPEDGQFIDIVTSQLKNDSMRIMTEDKVTETFYNLMESKPPAVELVCLNYDLSESIVGTVFQDVQFRIYYYPNLGGIPTHAKLSSYRFTSPEGEATTLFDDIELDGVEEHLDDFTPILKDNSDPEAGVEYYESRIIVVPYFKILDTPATSNTILAEVEYAANEKTIYPAGVATQTHVIRVYNSLQYTYGHYDREKEKYVMAEYINNPQYSAKEESQIKIHIYDKNNGVSRFAFRSPLEIKSIQYIQQHDEYFLDKLTEEYNETTKVYTYSWSGFDNYPIKSPLDFIIEL